MITIIESGGTNIASIQFALKRLGVTAHFSRNVDVIKQSSHLILPGVGSAGSAMQRLKAYALVDVIPSLTQPVLGICLGMQILFDFSEEGGIDCLKIIPGKIKRITDQNKLIVPHMGWNKLNILKNNLILSNIPAESYVYFVHSYIASVGEHTVATAHYGGQFSAVVQYKNFFGVQFHPERSGQIGSTMLKNFLEL